MTGNPPSWFRGAIVDGISLLMTLRLDGSPAADTIKATGAAWIRALWRRRWWHQERDHPRIIAAFDSIAASFTRWPAPAHLINALPQLDLDHPRTIRASIDHLHYRQQHDPYRDHPDSKDWYARKIAELQSQLQALPNQGQNK